MPEKLTHLQFVLKAIEASTTKEQPTMHTVFTGFNTAFRAYFPGDDPVKVVNDLFEQGHISFRLAVRGAIIAKPGIITPRQNTVEKADELLKKITGPGKPVKKPKEE